MKVTLVLAIAAAAAFATPVTGTATTGYYEQARVNCESTGRISAQPWFFTLGNGPQRLAYRMWYWNADVGGDWYAPLDWHVVPYGRDEGAGTWGAQYFRWKPGHYYVSVSYYWDFGYGWNGNGVWVPTTNYLVDADYFPAQSRVCRNMPEWTNATTGCGGNFGGVISCNPYRGDVTVARVYCAGAPATIVGTRGNDSIVGTPERDVIVAGAGNDRVSGAGGDDLLCGGSGNDALFGQEGADTLLGDTGRDRLAGGDGSDGLEGGPGNDVLDGGKAPAWDFARYWNARHPVHVDLGTGRSTGDGTDRLRYVNGVVGSRYDDELVGSRYDEAFVPFRGTDVVRAGGGRDNIIYSLSRHGVQVDLLRGLANGEGADRLFKVENVYGSAYPDELYGDANYNYLVGGAGNDLLDGRAGGDTLDAGDGSDLCLMGSAFVGCENQDGSLLLPPPPGTP